MRELYERVWVGDEELFALPWKPSGMYSVVLSGTELCSVHPYHRNLMREQMNKGERTKLNYFTYYL